MLLRGIYTFEPRPEDHDSTLSFSCNDTLIFLEVLPRDLNWIKVADILGRVGFVPKHFTEPAEHFDDHDLIMTFLVDAVVKARHNGLASASDLEALRDAIRKYPSIIEKRSRDMLKVFRGENALQSGPRARRSSSDQTIIKHSVRECSSPPQASGRQNLQRIGSDLDVRRTQQKTRHPEPPPQRNVSNVKRNMTVSDSSVRTANEEIVAGDKKSACSSFHTIQDIKSRLVTAVQETCGLSTKVSENLLIEVCQQIKESSSNLPVQSILDKLTAAASSTSSKSDPVITELEKVMKSMSKLSKEGIKERRAPGNRSRSIINESEFLEKLDKLQKLLIDSDPFKVIQILHSEQHAFSHDLVHLYHLDSPINLKEKLLDIFLILCTIDRKGRKALLATTLPLYLARELMSGTRGKRVFKQQMDLLISLLTCGERMPDTHFEIMGTGFVNFLLKELENDFRNSHGDWEYEKMVSDHISPLTNLILAYNLQFDAASKENVVLKVLAESRKRPRGFYAVVFQLFKNAPDPLQFEMNMDDDNPAQNSVLKMVNEICLCQSTKAQLTANDTQDLVDIIRNGLVGNSAGSVRLGYIQVLKSILDKYEGSLKDIRTALVSIFLDNDPLAIPEQQLIRIISKEFPTLFMRSISRISINVHGESEDNDNFSSRECGEDCFDLSS